MQPPAGALPWPPSPPSPLCCCAKSMSNTSLYCIVFRVGRVSEGATRSAARASAAASDVGHLLTGVWLKRAHGRQTATARRRLLMMRVSLTKASARAPAAPDRPRPNLWAAALMRRNVSIAVFKRGVAAQIAVTPGPREDGRENGAIKVTLERSGHWRALFFEKSFCSASYLEGAKWTWACDVTT